MQIFEQMIRRSDGASDVAEPLLAGNSVVAHALRQLVLLAAESNDTVMLRGPQGAGKLALARAIHRASAHPDEPFIDADCRQIGEDHFAVSWEGCLFLHDIELLSRAAQCALLGWMDSDQGQNVRIVAATSKASDGDGVIQPLQRRLSQIQIPCPALDQRSEDIAVILQRLWAKDIDHIPPIMNRDAWARLMAHSWPGNFTELVSFSKKASRLYGGHGISGDQIGRLLNEDCARRFDQSNFNLKQHLAQEEKIYLIEALLRSNGVLQSAAAYSGLKRTTFIAKMKRHGLARI